MKILKTVDKLVLKSYLGPLMASFFIVTFVLMMNFLWRFIDELVGKGLSAGLIMELLVYATTNMISLGFPLTTLFAAIMTMGNLGENYELLALKSAGVSLPRILRPLMIVTLFMAVASFFVTNNLVTYSNKKMYAILFDIRKQKQAIEFKDGLFFNGIENISVRVERQHPETKLLTGVLIYSTESEGGRMGDMTVTVADSGYIKLSDDRKFLVTTLYNGENFQLTRGRSWYDDNTLDRTSFEMQHGLNRTPGYDFSRSDYELFGNSEAMKNVSELETDIDSLEKTVNRLTAQTYGPLFNTYLFSKDTMVVSGKAEARASLAERRPAALSDSVPAVGLKEKSHIFNDAEQLARNSRSSITYDEGSTKEALNRLYRSQIEWHKKWSLPVAVVIFFLIGAPLGAIIRKGGLGMPIVISVSFFVLYYVISIMGEKMAKEGTWTAAMGIWMPTMVLLPVAVYLTYKATNDSNLLNVEWYIIKYNSLKARAVKLAARFKSSKNVTEKTA